MTHIEGHEQARSCMICGQAREGIIIFNQLLCGVCEREIIQTEVEDIRYPYYVAQLRCLSLPQNA